MIFIILLSMGHGMPNTYCLCGHVDGKESCLKSDICTWNGNSCVLGPGKTYIQEISDDSYNQCYRYAQEDCIKLPQCGFYLGECIPFIDCSVFQKSECQESSLKCASDGTKCIQRGECSDYLNQFGCQYKNIHDKYCYWNTKCQEAETCAQLPNYLTSDALCRAAIQNCTVSDLGFGCQDSMKLCSEYQFENQCFYDQSVECFWQDDKCFQKTCENRKLKTDDECVLFDSKCTSNGINCVMRRQCSDANQYGCVTDQDGNKCVFNNVCQLKTCSTAPITYNYQLCQLYELDCVTKKSGGCKERPIDCIGYEVELDCHSIEDCIWYADACAKRQCFHAPLSYTHEQCKTFGLCMGKSGGGCQLRGECAQILEQQYCDIDIQGNNCVWENGQCQDLICSNLRLPNYDSHAKCYAASKYCTFNIEIGGCVDYKCDNVIELDACTVDAYANQCKIYDGCILKRCKLAPSSYQSNSECESWDSTCTVNVYQFNTFILLFGCMNKVNQCQTAFQQQCYSTITNVQCKWDSIQQICISKSCADADQNLFVKGSSTYKCENYLVDGAKCILDSSDKGCIEWPNACANMLNQEQCNLGLEDGTECSWNSLVCQNKQCSDAYPIQYTDNITCNKWKPTCIYKPNLLGCQDRQPLVNCSSSPYGYMYDSHEECQAWNPNCTVAYDVGCTVKQSNCTDYKSENQCKITLSGTYCYWDQGSESCQSSNCNLRVGGELTHSDCEQFMPTCTINNPLNQSCVALSITCSSYTQQQQCIVNASQQPCQWDYKMNACIDLSCNSNTTAKTERECYNMKRSFACQLKYDSNRIFGSGCEDRPSSCSQVTEEKLCNQTITISQDRCFYFQNQCQIISKRDCHQITNSTSNEECIYYNNQCMLQYSGKGCQSIKYCEQLTDLNCNSSILSMNTKCIYYANRCISNNNCSNLYPSDSSCDGKRTSYNEQCQYQYLSSGTLCGSKQCSKQSLSGNVLQNHTQCQKFSSICTYDLTTRSCTEIINCNDLTAYGIIDFKLCNDSMTYNHQKCGFNFISNTCENRRCEHLQSSNPQICYDWNYDCIFDGINCITFSNQCSLITLVYQCLHYQCYWYDNSCHNLINCQINTTAVTNYECELINSICKLDFIQNGCAYQQCSDIIDSILCDTSHTSDGLECYWVSGCIPKQCDQFTSQVTCESRYGVISNVSSKCYWCSSQCSNNYTCDPTILSPPIKHTDCYSNDVTKTIYFNQVPKCVTKSANCSDYLYPEACQTTLSGQKCYWNLCCLDYCLSSPGPFTHQNCYNFDKNCMAATSNTSCQYLDCTSITNQLDCNRFLNQCIWQTSCIKIQGCITFTQVNCIQNEELIPCYWDSINLKCDERTCSNIQIIPTSNADCSSWLQNCQFDTFQCTEDCEAAVGLIHETCESYYLSKKCTVKYANRHCTDLPATCESAQQSQCYIDINQNKCYFNNRCVTFSCSVLGIEFNSHDKCQQYECTVNQTLNGCIQLTTCTSYQIKEQCHIDNNKSDCQWLSTQCVLKKCETAQLIKYTSGSCQQFYGQTCTVNQQFNTCTMAADKCSDYDYYQCISDGQKNLLGVPCFWQSDNDQCAELICKNGPKLATSNKECQGFLSSCQKGGCRLKICSDFKFVIDQDCAGVFQNNRCATNGYYCIERKLCEDMYTEDGCTFDIYNKPCLWIKTPAEKCITKICGTAPLNLSTDNQCRNYLPECTAKKGGGCMQRKECSDNLIKEACYSDQYGLGCIWDDYLQVCVSDQCEGFCGDGIISGFEICDDGNYLPYDGCYKCQIQCPLGCVECDGKKCQQCDSKGWYLNGVVCQTKCGDGVAVGKEYCDDGNDIEYDGCYNCQYSCDINCLSCYQGECFECPYGFYEIQSYCMNKCGDGIFATQVEECEDGNTQSKDGCSSECQIEKNWKCITIDNLSVCSYNISPSFQLLQMPYNHGQNQEIHLTFSEQVRLNSQDISQDYFLQLIQAQITNSKDYTIQVSALTSITYDLSNPVYLIRVKFTSSTVSPLLSVTIECENLINQYENQLSINQQKIQLKDPFILSSTQKFVAANAALFNQYVIYSLISIGVVSFLSGNLEILWNLIDLLQQLSYIKYLNIQFPENLAIYFEVFGLVTVQPLVDKVDLNGRVEQLFSIETPFLPASGKFQDFQINSYFGVNLQSFVLVVAIGVLNYVASYLFQLILTSIRYNNWPVTFDQQQRCVLTQIVRVMYALQKASKAYFKYFFYSGLIRIYLSNYYDITFSAFLQIFNFNTQNKLNTVNSYLAIGLLSVNLFIFLSFYQLMCQRYIGKKFQILAEGLHWGGQFHVIQLFKKTLFIANLVLVQGIPLIQPIISSLISGIFAVFIYKAQPFVNKFENYKLIITEILIAFNTVLFSIQEMLKLYSKLEMQSSLGWMNIIGFTLILLSTLIIDFYQQVAKYIRILCYYLQNVICQNQKPKTHVITFY